MGSAAAFSLVMGVHGSMHARKPCWIQDSPLDNAAGSPALGPPLNTATHTAAPLFPAPPLAGPPGHLRWLEARGGGQGSGGQAQGQGALADQPCNKTASTARAAALLQKPSCGCFERADANNNCSLARPVLHLPGLAGLRGPPHPPLPRLALAFTHSASQFPLQSAAYYAAKKKLNALRAKAEAQVA